MFWQDSVQDGNKGVEARRVDAFMASLKKLNDALSKLEEWLLLCGLGAMFIVLLVQVISRYLFNYSLIWSEVFARYMYLWIVFLGISFGVRNKKHIRVSILYDHYPRSFQKFMYIFLDLAALVFFTIQIPVGIRFCQGYFAVPAAGLPISMGCVYLALPIGYTTVSLRLIAEIITTLLEKGPNGPIKEEC